jgi:phospholipid-binding lipoprotein MlaA
MSRGAPGLRVGALLLCAAAATPLAQAQAAAPNPADPWEPFNRGVHAFNEKLDEALVRPVATTYRDVVPQLVRTGVENVFGNVADVWSAANHLLQGKPEPAAEMTMRVVINTWLGLGGLLDVASEAGLHRQPEDFGQTLGRWGIGPGPYVVLPLFGPRTLRDAAGMPLDWRGSLQSLPHEARWRFALSGLDAVQTRAGLLGATSVVDQIALDKYSFVRDSHLARRRNLVYDGDPPPERDDVPVDAPR